MERPKRKKRKKLLPFLAVLIPALYILLQVLLVAQRGYTTQVAMTDTLDDALLCSGVIGVNEQEIRSEAAGVLDFIAANGERISSGDGVAYVYADEAAARSGRLAARLSDELEVLEQSQRSAGAAADMESLMGAREDETADILAAAASGDLSGAQDVYGDLQATLNQIAAHTDGTADFSQRISELTAQRDAAAAAASAQSLAAPAAGYFVCGQDAQQKQYTLEQLSQMTPAQLAEAAESPAQSCDAQTVGKLWLDYKWYFYASVSAADASRFEQGDTLHISFPDLSDESVPIEVVSVEVDEGAGVAKVELMSEYINADIVTLEQARARISFATYTGLRVDREALHVFEGQNMVYVKSGNMAYLRPVTVIFANDSYALLSDDYEKDVNEVKRYDTVIVRGDDLYDKKILS